MENFTVSVQGEQVVYVVHFPLVQARQVVLFGHGMPGVNRLPGLPPFLAEQGIAWVEINYRGDPASEGIFSFFGSTEDFLAVATQLRAQCAVPIHGLGYSAGGLYLLRAIRAQPSLLRSAMLVSPLVDTEFLRTSRHLPDLWNAAQERLTLHPKDMYAADIARLHAAHNPMDFAAELTTPIHLIQSSNDEILPAADAQRFFAKLTGEKT